MPDFNPQDYVHAPRLDVRSAVTVSIALLKCAPANLPPAGKKAVKRLRSSVAALQSAWAERDRLIKPAAPVDPRTVDTRADTAWGGLYGRLDCLAWLPDAASPRVARAARLRDSLFPHGKTFLQLPYREEWAEVEKRLQRIDNEKLAKDIDDLAGPEFLVEIRAAHVAYTRVVQDALQGVNVDITVELRKPLKKVCDALAAYTTQLVATVDPDDDATLTVARAALTPIDVYRAQMAARAGADSTAADSPVVDSPLPPAGPTTPIPEVK